VARSPDARASSREWAALLLLAATVALCFQGARGLYESSEGRYSESAREMLSTGNFLEPKLDGRPHWTKPPLSYWSIAAGMAVFGRNEYGARFANAAAFLLTVLAVGATGSALWGRTAGIAAGLVYATSPFPALAASTVTTDTILTLWEVCAVLCYVLAVRPGESEAPRTATVSRAWMAGMWACFGLGFMTKGPPALLPLAAVAVWHRLGRRRARLADPVGPAIFAAVALPWFGLVSLENPGLLSYFLGKEVVARVTTDDFGRNAQWYMPFVLYLPLLILGPGAWSFHSWKLFTTRRLYDPRRLVRTIATGSPGALLLLWLLIPLSVFFVSRSRLPLYVLPLFAPVSLAIGRGLPRRVWALAVLCGLALVAIKGGSSLLDSPKDMRRLHALCQEMAGPRPQVYVFSEEELFGLEFYLDGRFGRMTPTGDEPWADATVSDVLAEIARDPEPGRFALVAADHALHSLERALESSPLPFHCREQLEWAVCAATEHSR
jgi:4-amino-4-deoxy-L-arabinose transferase